MAAHLNSRIDSSSWACRSFAHALESGSTVADFVSELQRRSVLKVGIAYAVIAWLVAQVADVVLDAFPSAE